MEERFGGRLILKDNFSNKPQSIVDRVLKNVKQQQLNPESEEKWTHDRYEEPVNKRIKTIERRREPTPEKKSVEVKQEPISKPNDKMNKVLVRNLPSDVNEAQVKKIFSRYGEVKKAQIEEGFVIITFTDNEGALQAHYITNCSSMYIPPPSSGGRGLHAKKFLHVTPRVT